MIFKLDLPCEVAADDEFSVCYIPEREERTVLKGGTP
jgi:hypothetical protein